MLLVRSLVGGFGSSELLKQFGLFIDSVDGDKLHNWFR